MKYEIFLSYASEDSEFVKHLAKALDIEGISTWYDHYVLKIGDSLRDKIDDGLIRVEFAFEKPKPEILTKTIIHDHHHHDHHHWNYGNWFTGDSTVRYGSAMGISDDNIQATYSNNAGDMVRGMSSGPVESINMVQVDSLGVEANSQPLADEGITVKGSECDQFFRYGSIGELEQSKVITIQLRGTTAGGVQVQQPVTVKTKLECSSCGTKSKSSFKFCPNCGTFLE